MHAMKKLLVPTLCVLLGCAGGAAMGNVTAQSWQEPMSVQRWQQECETVPVRQEAVNALFRARGEAGWEFVGALDGRPTACFKRPAP